MTTTRVLELDGVNVSFGFGPRRKHVLHDVSLGLDEGRTLGLVGESGSGKSTLAKVVVGLVRPASGRVLIDGEDMAGAGRERIARLRRRIQLIPQDPYASLNPRMTVGDALAEAIDPRRGRASGHRPAITELLARVSMDADAADRYPHAFSGGQRQRVAIARALAVRPEVIVADEVTSALDCSVQAEVLGVLRELRASTKLTMLFISHDLAVVRQVSDEVAVMSGGRIVEHEQRDRLFAAPRHTYTKLLLASVPDGRPLREHRPG